MENSLKFATWNINGIKARHDNLLDWLKECRPDIVCLQEIKSMDEKFPSQDIEALGYNVKTHGQKSFNGVAILSKIPFDEVNYRLPGTNHLGEDDEQARFIEGVFSTGKGAIRVACLYLPNGNPVESDKFRYKLNWMDRLQDWAKDALKLEEPLLMAGDYNIIPQNEDCHDPELWAGDALFRPESRERFWKLCNLGFTDAIRNVTSAHQTYTFWDYQAGAWPKNNGIRIDHLLMSPQLADKLQAAGIDKFVRDWEKPSDHVPVWIEVAL